MARDSDGDLARLRAEVTSKGGTTEAALRSFDAANLRGIVAAGAQAPPPIAAGKWRRHLATRSKAHMNALVYIVDSLLTLYLYVLILRFVMQLVRADFRNQIAARRGAADQSGDHAAAAHPAADRQDRHAPRWSPSCCSPRSRSALLLAARRRRSLPDPLTLGARRPRAMLIARSVVCTSSAHLLYGILASCVRPVFAAHGAARRPVRTRLSRRFAA